MEGLPIEAVHDFKIAANGSAAAKKFLEESEAWYSAVTMSKPTLARIEPLSAWAKALPDHYLGLHQMREGRSGWYMQQIGKPFLFRAAMHFEAGSFADGLKDLEVVYTAAKNCETYFLAGYRRALHLDQHANNELINGLVLCPSIDAEFALRWVQAPVNLRPDEDVVKMLDERYRFESIDHLQYIHRCPVGSQGNVADVPPRFQAMARRFSAHRLDFSELLRFENRQIDQFCEAMKKPTYREQRLSIETLLGTSTRGRRQRTLTCRSLAMTFNRLPRGRSQIIDYAGCPVKSRQRSILDEHFISPSDWLAGGRSTAITLIHLMC